METVGHRGKVSIIYILNQAEEGCGDVVSMKYFIQNWKMQSICFTVWAKLGTEGIIFCLLVFLHCVFVTLTFENSLLSVWYLKHPTWLSDALIVKLVKKINKQWQTGVAKKKIASCLHKEGGEQAIHPAADRHTSMISFWFCWCLIIDRAPLSRVSREKRRKRERQKTGWKSSLATHFNNFHLPLLSFCIFYYSGDREVRTWKSGLYHHVSS